MPVLIHLPTIEHRNAIGFQMIIQRAFQLYRDPNVLRMSQWATCPSPCHAGVGAPSGRYAGQIGLQLCQGLFQRSLHGGQVILPLPAVEPLAMVFNFQSISRHGLCHYPVDANLAIAATPGT